MPVQFIELDSGAELAVLPREEYKWVLTSMVPRGGIEPPTLRFSVACSTN